MVINLLAIFLLLFMNGFFVASEFGLVSVRQTKMAQLANEGDKTAEMTVKALDNLDRYIAATQLGITIASIGLGWVGEATLAQLIQPVLDFLPETSISAATHSIATAIAFALITLMHVVIGELMPKSIALQFPEKTALTITRPLVFASKIFSPFIFLLNGLGNFLLKLIHVEPARNHHSVHSEEEIDMIIDESYKGGVLNETESFLLKNTLKFTDLMAKQIMVPRCNVVAIPIDATKEEFAQLILENQYTRYPVFEEDLDNIQGILHVKDMYSCVLKNEGKEIKEVLRKPLYVPETMTADSLLEEFKNNRTEIAIVIDEFGSMSGIISLEDVLEEVFGSVEDEFDEEEKDIRKVGENKYIINGLYRVEDFFEFFNLTMEEDEVETIGGLVQKSLCSLGKVNDEIEIKNLKIKVIEIKKRRINKLLVEQIKKEEVEENNED